MKKGPVLLSILCVLFNFAIIAVVSYLCISGIVNSAAKGDTINGVRIFINVFIIVIVVITLGWLIKR